jgi:hypothetical protein
MRILLIATLGIRYYRCFNSNLTVSERRGEENLARGQQ